MAGLRQRMAPAAAAAPSSSSGLLQGVPDVDFEPLAVSESGSDRTWLYIGLAVAALILVLGGLWFYKKHYAPEEPDEYPAVQ